MKRNVLIVMIVGLLGLTFSSCTNTTNSNSKESYITSLHKGDTLLQILMFQTSFVPRPGFGSEKICGVKYILTTPKDSIVVVDMEADEEMKDKDKVSFNYDGSKRAILKSGIVFTEDESGESIEKRSTALRMKGLKWFKICTEF